MSTKRVIFDATKPTRYQQIFLGPISDRELKTNNISNEMKVWKAVGIGESESTMVGQLYNRCG